MGYFFEFVSGCSRSSVAKQVCFILLLIPLFLFRIYIYNTFFHYIKKNRLIGKLILDIEF